MVQKELSRFKYILLIGLVFIIACTAPEKDHSSKFVFEEVDVSGVTDTTVSNLDTNLVLINGVYFFGSEPYNGYIFHKYKTDTTQKIASFLNGKEHGLTKTYFPDGTISTITQYKDNLAYGHHIHYWPNGNLKFDFSYNNDKREGLQKQWYEEGIPYCELSFIDDKEEGMQKAWRRTGKPYINYEVKDGRRYGLQKSAMCYTLKEGEIK